MKKVWILWIDDPDEDVDGWSFHSVWGDVKEARAYIEQEIDGLLDYKLQAYTLGAVP